MLLLRLLLSSSLTFIAARPFSADINSNNTTINFRLLKYVVPIHYNISLQLSIEDNAFYGICTVHFRVLRRTQTIKLHSKNLKLNDPVVTDNVHVYKAKMWIDEESHIVSLNYNDTLPSGEYTLNVTYSGLISDAKGFFETSYIRKKGDRKKLIASRIHAIEARRMFPCWDEPALKATFRISICHPINYMAFSNMPTRELQLIGNNTTWTHFHTTPTMSTYLLGIMLSDFFDISSADINIQYRSQSALYLKFADIIVENITRYFENKLGDLKEHSKIHHVAIPGYPEDSITNWGLAFYRETDIIYDNKLHINAQKINIARKIAYGVTYQWFGSLVSPSWWSYLWLNEGITTLVAADAIDKTFSKSRMKDLFVVQIQHESLRLDTDTRIMKPLIHDINSNSEINSLFSFSYYIKAPVILRMMRYMLTDEVFWSGLIRYLSNHRLSSATLDHFWAAMQTAYDETEMSKRNLYNITNMMHAWTKTERYPVLNVTRLNAFTVIISIENIDVLNYYDWYIPVTVTTYIDEDFTFSKTWIWLNGTKNNYSFIHYRSKIGNDCIIVNLQQAGYYRVMYDIDSWSLIRGHLNLMNYTKIHVLNRAQIIDDAFYFLTTSQIKLSLFLDLTEYLWRETDYIAWYPMFKAFEYMSGFLPFGESAFLQEKMLAILERLYFKNRNIDNKQLFTESLMMEVARWRAVFGSPACMMSALSTLQQILKFSRRIEAGCNELAYCIGLMVADNVTWHNVFNIYVEKSNNEILKFLACSKRPGFIINYMEIIASKYYNEKMSSYDRVKSFHSIVVRHAANLAILEYILANFERIIPREINTFVTLVDIINHVYFTIQLDKIKEYVDNMKPDEDVTLTIKNNYFHQELLRLTKDDMDFKRVVWKSIVQYMKRIILFINRKIELRHSQIKKHKHNFHYLMQEKDQIE